MLVHILFLLLILPTFAAEKKTFKKTVNETAGQIDGGTRRVIKQVKDFVKPKEKKP